jgi:hypothetical protein
MDIRVIAVRSLDEVKDLSLLQRVQTGSRAHPVYYTTHNGEYFSRR